MAKCLCALPVLAHTLNVVCWLCLGFQSLWKLAVHSVIRAMYRNTGQDLMLLHTPRSRWPAVSATVTPENSTACGKSGVSGGGAGDCSDVAGGAGVSAGGAGSGSGSGAGAGAGAGSGAGAADASDAGGCRASPRAAVASAGNGVAPATMPPLLMQLSHPRSAHVHALRQFEHRTLVALVDHDMSVPFASASVSRSDYACRVRSDAIGSSR